MPNVCALPLPAGSSTLLCPREKFRLPTTGKLSKHCYWHRLDRCAMEFQVKEAERRAALPRVADRARVPESEWPADERWCAGCQAFVPLWYCRGSRCAACAYVARRDSRNEHTYGLGREAFDALLSLQDGKCAICGKRQLDRSIATEHDHKSGAVRGLCCKGCNKGILGSAYDSVRMLRAAVYYLENPPTSGRWSIEERNAFCDLDLSGLARSRPRP